MASHEHGNLPLTGALLRLKLDDEPCALEAKESGGRRKMLREIFAEA
jgi:hypothetical protein